MLHQILAPLILIITGFIQQFHYLAVIILMAFESANIPIPSEVILTYAGFLVSQGTMNIHLAAFAGAVGCLIGSIPSYYIGLKLGRPFLEKYGKWLLVSRHDLALAEKFLARYGEATYFISRLLPVIRTFIGLAVGVSKGSFWKFNLYGFIASWIWSYLLVYIGVKLGENWEVLRPYWDRFSLAIVLLIIAAILWHVIRVFRGQPDNTPVK
jgi:membrane protein DedA with SNARE-associated domain